LKRQLEKMIKVFCVICEKEIESPTCYSVTCSSKKCQNKYQRYLMWDKREKAKQKAKDYKLLKIIKSKEKPFK